MVKKEIREFIVNREKMSLSVKEEILSVIDNINEKPNIIDKTYNNIRIFMEICKGLFIINNKENDHISILNKIMNDRTLVYQFNILIDTQVNVIEEIIYIIDYLDKIYSDIPVIFQRRVVCAIEYFNNILTNITCSKELYDKMTYFKKNTHFKRVYGFRHVKDNLRYKSVYGFELEHLNKNRNDLHNVTKSIIKKYLIHDLRIFNLFKTKFKHVNFNKVYQEIVSSILSKDKWIKIMDDMYCIPSLPDPSDFLIFYEKKVNKISESVINRTYSVYSIRDNTPIIKSFPKLPSLPYSEAAKFSYISENTLNNISNRIPFNFVKGFGAVFTKRLKVEEVVATDSYTIKDKNKNENENKSKTNIIEDSYLDYEIVKSNFSSSRYDKKLNTKKDKHNPYIKKNKKKIKKRFMCNRKNKLKNSLKTHADSSFIDDRDYDDYIYYDDDGYYSDDYDYDYDDRYDNSHRFKDHDEYEYEDLYHRHYYDSYDDDYYY